MKSKMIIWVVIVLLVMGGLVFITINGQGSSSQTNNTNMNKVLELEGVKATILQEGTGVEAVAGNMVSMNYTGTFTDGTAFDSNIDPAFGHPQPFVFTLGSGQVIKGWDIGVSGMKVGEKRKLEIESAYAYGERGAGGVIPPNANLVFEVELVSIN